ncbi:chromodomain-helicase-DNA-binding protein 8 [Guaruba guarouba]
MADPIMDLFDDPNLFALDPLADDAFGPAPPPPPQPMADDALAAPPPPIGQPADDPLAPPPDPPEQELIGQLNPFMGAAAAAPPPPNPPKLLLLKPHVTADVTGPARDVTGPAPSSTNGGGAKVTLAKVLAGGVSLVGAGPGGGASVATPPPAVHRLVPAARPVKQLVLQPVKAGPGKGGGAAAAAANQGESKRITLVLQQPPGGSVPAGQRHVVLGTLPGKLVLQGNQLSAVGQAKGAQGQATKVVTIQLQVQQPPGAGQGGAPPKIQVLQPAAGGQGTAVNVASVPQVVAGAGQRLTVPLKVVLQPQTPTSAGASSGLSVVKVLSTPDLSCHHPPGGGGAAAAPRGASEESRKLEHQKKQEKANRIVAEAIARARARGEQNIPRVLNEDELPHVRPDDDAAERKRRRKGDRGAAAKEDRSRKGKGQSGAKSKGRSKPSTITPVVGKKRKRNASSDTSDAEVLPAPSPRQEEEPSVQKRRSNRQVKRKKYTEDLDIKITDDEEDEELDVTGPARPEQPPAPPAPEPEGEALPSMQFFVENPSEEDAAIVDKVLSMRVVKKELPSGQLVESEEFFVKYKNYSYLHCEWATIDQLEKDKRIHQKLKRFKTKMTQMRHFFHEDEEPFNPDYVEVDRILDESHSVDKDNGEPVVYYLVKWCSLPYEDSTWELQEDVDEGKIGEFKRIQARNPELKRLPRPQAGSWKKLELCHEYKNHNQLREYQLEGVNWLLFNWYNRQNCILADEMGLGKTIQSIAFLQEVYKGGIHGPFLVIAPLSTITNWEREFNTWTEMNTIVYHGSLASRQMIQQYEMYCKDTRGRLIPGAYKFDALITTFEMILSECPELREIEWRCVVIDEAHRLKNRNCKLLDSLKHMDLEHKVLLTGTPLQNTVEELFSLLHFLEPSQFPSEGEFLKDFGDLKTEEQVQKLQAILKPMMLRRLKEDVEKNLAPKQETIIEVELTNIQKKYYRAILEKNFSFLAKGAGHTNMPNLLNTMMELRKCCNHPYLINGAEEKILAEFRDSCPHQVPVDFHLQAMVRSAGKLVLIDKLLPKLKAGGHKVLIFSQMVRCLDILEDYLIQKRYLYERLDGRVRGNLRQAAIDRFSRPDSDRFVFLLCTRAGGLGINLTAADTCIIFDSDWNPQNDLQAQARCHRIGQSKAVKVYRLITRSSYEREMFDKASLKLGLDRAVLQSMSGREGGIAGQIQQFSKKEIEDLLRRGAYAAIMEEDDEGSKFCEEDIDQILLRRATTITIESQGQGSTFAKASFVASENRTDIALDDPNFWQKWAKKADLDLELLNSKDPLVLDTPRLRKQTRPFSALRDDDLVELSELESDDEERPRPRRPPPAPPQHLYGRAECLRLHRHLLLYGWMRWMLMDVNGCQWMRWMSMDEMDAVDVDGCQWMRWMQWMSMDEMDAVDVDGRQWMSMDAMDAMDGMDMDAVDVDGRQWMSMDADGCQWMPMDRNGCQWMRWMLMDVNGCQRMSMVVNGCDGCDGWQWMGWMSMDVKEWDGCDGCRWMSMDADGCQRMPMDGNGCQWMSMDGMDAMDVDGYVNGRDGCQWMSMDGMDVMDVNECQQMSMDVDGCQWMRWMVMDVNGWDGCDGWGWMAMDGMYAMDGDGWRWMSMDINGCQWMMMDGMAAMDVDGCQWTWGRWPLLVAPGRPKRRLAEREAQRGARAILTFCLLHGPGEDALKAFVWDLIGPADGGRGKEGPAGVAVPLPRGRKGRKGRAPPGSWDSQRLEWLRRQRPEQLLQDPDFREHLQRHGHRLLLRVRMLQFLQHEVIGEQAQRVLAGAKASSIALWLPPLEDPEAPAPWWDPEADKSLLLGVFKHGWERYEAMRADPALCFRSRAGSPDPRALEAEERRGRAEGVDIEDPEYPPLMGPSEEEEEEEPDPLLMLEEEISVVDADEGKGATGGGRTHRDAWGSIGAPRDLPPVTAPLSAPGPPPPCGPPWWPPAPVLTARLRRLIGALQRSQHRDHREQHREQHRDHRDRDRDHREQHRDRRRRRCELKDGNAIYGRVGEGNGIYGRLWGRGMPFMVIGGGERHLW